MDGFESPDSGQEEMNILKILWRKITRTDYKCQKCGERIYLKDGWIGHRQHGCPNNCGFKYFPPRLKKRYGLEESKQG